MKFEQIVFLQDEEAELALAILTESGETSALEFLKQWHCPGEHAVNNQSSRGQADKAFTEGKYLMSYNLTKGYIGLEHMPTTLHPTDSLNVIFPTVCSEHVFTQLNNQVDRETQRKIKSVCPGNPYGIMTACYINNTFVLVSEYDIDSDLELKLKLA